ncbi:recombinase family protein [Altericroceibacterium xinjiangense]|uniref:recombinase family protein n=1 Tax=Altericroceibacterium xinjiangense TaxID=762261 RepID=UPI000F7F7714|nr:recombinase family protein [Altericroceibacterium xinjiangense]
MLVGYGRVSSAGQSLDVQLNAFRAAGCEKVFAEKRSGTSREKRIELSEALSYVREGDTLVVTRLDRLTRSAGDLHTIVKQLADKGVSFLCIQQAGLDTSSSTGKLLLGMLASIAEFEADIRRERQREGIERAKAAGVYKGRKPSVNVAAVRTLKAEGIGATEIAKQLGIGRASVYRELQQ